jgi:hypothetical protein
MLLDIGGKEASGMKVEGAGGSLIHGLAGAAPALLACAVLFTGCTPETALTTVEDYDVVVTLYDRSADFGSIRTYAMPDSIVYIRNPGEPGTELNRDFDRLILDTVEAGVGALGYTAEPNPKVNGADLYVLVYATSAEWNAADHPWYAYWGWYPGMQRWDTGWSFCYPYYGGGGVYTFSSGTIVIDMIDSREAGNDDENIPAVWTGILNGFMNRGSALTKAQRLEAGINQAFDQSPYLGAEY